MIYTLWGVRSVVIFCYVFFWKFWGLSFKKVRFKCPKVLVIVRVWDVTQQCPKLWIYVSNVPNFGKFETSFVIGETSVYQLGFTLASVSAPTTCKTCQKCFANITNAQTPQSVKAIENNCQNCDYKIIPHHWTSSWAPRSSSCPLCSCPTSSVGYNLSVSSRSMM